MIIDCISDLHGHYPYMKGGDLLILAGDYTSNDSEEGWWNFEAWIRSLSYKKIIMVAGNHDNFLSSMKPDRAHRLWKRANTNIFYLCDSGTEFDGLKIWGSPWTSIFHGINPQCTAFTVEDDSRLSKKWERIPDDTDILVTHCPLHGYFDTVLRLHEWVTDKQHIGSESLKSAVLDRIKPKVHVFGHIHEWGGSRLDTGLITFVNASHVNAAYQPVNKSIRIEL